MIARGILENLPDMCFGTFKKTQFYDLIANIVGETLRNIPKHVFWLIITQIPPVSNARDDFGCIHSYTTTCTSRNDLIFSVLILFIIYL